jgi:PAS domain S-box-containing protein
MAKVHTLDSAPDVTVWSNALSSATSIEGLIRVVAELAVGLCRECRFIGASAVSVSRAPNTLKITAAAGVALDEGHPLRSVLLSRANGTVPDSAFPVRENVTDAFRDALGEMVWRELGADRMEGTSAIVDGVAVAALFRIAPADHSDPSPPAAPDLDLLLEVAAPYFAARYYASLSRHREHLHHAVTGAGFGTWEWRVDTGETIFDERWAELIGYTLEELAPTTIETWHDLVHPDDIPSVERAVTRHFTGEDARYESEHRLRHRDGRWVWVLDRGRTIEWNPDGSPRTLYGVHTDITRRKEAEQRVAESEERFRMVSESSSDGILVFENKRAVVVSPAYKELVGFSAVDTVPEEFTSIFSLVHPDDRGRIIAIMDHAFAERAPAITFQYRGKHREGSYRWREDSMRLIYDADGAHRRSYVVVRDIHDRRMREDRLRDEEARFRALFESNPALIVVCSVPDGTYVDANPAFISASGIPRQEVPAHSLQEIGISSGDLDDPRDLSRREVSITGPDGEVINGLLTGELLEYRGKRHLLCVIIDITEERRARREAIAASKAKSEFLSSMSHELRTPLNGIVGFTNLLLNEPLSPVHREYLNHVSRSARTLMQLINDILDLSRIEAGKIELHPESTDLRGLLGDVVDIVRHPAATKGLELILSIPPDVPWTIVIDALRLKQILVNLIGNAVKFTPAGEIELSAVCEEQTETRGRIRFSLRDTGPGIPRDEQARIFEMFVQGGGDTALAIQGTGLGLAISNQLVRQMGGTSLSLESTPGVGSTFSFVLPAEILASGDPHAKEKEPRERLISRALIIEPNPRSRDAVRGILESWGVSVAAVGDGDEARSRLEEAVNAAAPPELILFDESIEAGPEIAGLIASGDEASLLRIVRMTRLPRTLEQDPPGLVVASTIRKPVRQEDLAEYVFGIETPREEQWKGESSPPPASAGRELSILIADDDPTSLLLTRTLVERSIPEATVATAVNGEEAVTAYRHLQPDLILMDVNMPVLDGREATRRIRALEGGERVEPATIVALTAAVTAGEQAACIQSGMNDHLTKPVDEGELARILTACRRALVPPTEETVAPPAPAEAAAPLPFDRTGLLGSIHGDERLLAEFEALFRREFPGKLAELRAAAAHPDAEVRREETRAGAHRISGTARTMRMPRLARAATALEAYMGESQPDPSRAAALLAEVEAAYAEVLPCLEKGRIDTVVGEGGANDRTNHHRPGESGG